MLGFARAQNKWDVLTVEPAQTKSPTNLKSSLRCFISSCKDHFWFLLVARLIKLRLDATWHFEVCHQTITPIGNFLDELNAASPQFIDRLVNVLAIKRNVVRARRFTIGSVGGVTTHLGLGQVEDEPSVAHVGEWETQLVSNECSQLLGSRGIEHRVNACNPIRG